MFKKANQKRAQLTKIPFLGQFYILFTKNFSLIPHHCHFNSEVIHFLTLRFLCSLRSVEMKYGGLAVVSVEMTG